MENLSSLNERTKESVSVLKQSTAWADNQSVLNRLGEDKSGKLTYKNVRVGSKATNTHHFWVGDVTAVPTTDGKGVRLFIPANTIPSGQIIDKITLYADEVIDIRVLSEIDGNLYVVNYGAITESPFNGNMWLATIWSPSSSEIIEGLKSQIYEMDVEYSN